MVVLSILKTIDAETGGESSIVIDKGDVKTARVCVHEPFSVKLPVQRGVGVSWSINKLPKSVVVLTESVESPGDLRPGGSEYKVFRMRLNEPTTEQIVFSLVQPYDSEQKPSRVVTLNITPSS